MNKQFKTKGIIIRRFNLNEADQIVTLLTPKLGKIHCMAKGSRRHKSRFCGRLELFYKVNIIGFHGKTLEHINEIDVIDINLQDTSLQKHGVLFYIAEITNRLIQDGQQVEGVFSLLEETVRQLKLEGDHDVILRAHLIKLLTLLGFMAPWNTCAISGQKLNQNEPIYFNQVDTSIVSGKYASPNDTRLPIPIVKWINFMQQSPFSDIVKVTTTQGDQHQVKQLLEIVLRNILNTPLKSESFLTMVQ